MFAVGFLAPDFWRDDSGGFHHVGLQRLLQMLAQVARLPRKERLRRSSLCRRKYSEKGKVFIRQLNHNRAHGAMMPRPRSAAKLVLEFSPVTMYQAPWAIGCAILEISREEKLCSIIERGDEGSILSADISLKLGCRQPSAIPEPYAPNTSSSSPSPNAFPFPTQATEGMPPDNPQPQLYRPRGPGLRWQGAAATPLSPAPELADSQFAKWNTRPSPLAVKDLPLLFESP